MVGLGEVVWYAAEAQEIDIHVLRHDHFSRQNLKTLRTALTINYNAPLTTLPRAGRNPPL
jgi:hypothetical protein